MRIEGRINRWNDDRGFGFITSDQGGQDIFVHISACPKDGQRPSVGERVNFEIESGSDGKKRAIRLMCPDRIHVMTPRPRPARREAGRPGFARPVLALLVLIGVAIFAYDRFGRGPSPAGLIEIPPRTSELPAAASSAATAFRCDGRTHCSQMTSCAEANYFLKHCPNVQMDGNRDGVPCKQQWCTGSFAR